MSVPKEISSIFFGAVYVALESEPAFDGHAIGGQGVLRRIELFTAMGDERFFIKPGYTHATDQS